MSEPYQKPKRFYSLDVLRGIAALSVVVLHWQHFWLAEPHSTPLVTTKQPFYSLLFLGYSYGNWAVKLFFCLSGFIFYYLYSRPVHEKAVAVKDFFILRFSRLYPLHFATLVLVALGMFVYRRQTGSNFIYPNDDARHFLLNLFFAQQWGLQKSFSFNGPTWSVSIEVLMYIIFFAACRFFPVKFPAILAFLVIGLGVERAGCLNLGFGLISFFIGGCICLIYDWLVVTKRVNRVASWLPLLTGALWLWALLIIKTGGRFMPKVASHFSLPIIHIKLYDYVLERWPVFVLFPLLILSLALIETQRGTLGKRVSSVGDITYSSYLLHFPLQLLTFVVVTQFTTDRSFFYSPSVFLSFFAILIALSVASYHWFEVPAQRYIRQRLLKSKPSKGS